MAKNINYQHLFYFWNVVKEGSFTKAGKKLGLAQPTISGQILTFEKSMGSTLISRNGRNISLTETGHIVFNYAQKIFSLHELLFQNIKNTPQMMGKTLLEAKGLSSLKESQKKWLDLSGANNSKVISDTPKSSGCLVLIFALSGLAGSVFLALFVLI